MIKLNVIAKVGKFDPMCTLVPMSPFDPNPMGPLGPISKLDPMGTLPGPMSRAALVVHRAQF